MKNANQKQFSRETAREILLSSKSTGLRRKAHCVTKYTDDKGTCGLYEMENTETGWYLIGGLDEAIDFLFAV